MAPETKFIHNYANCLASPEKAMRLLSDQNIITANRPFTLRNVKETNLFLDDDALYRYLNHSDPFIQDRRRNEKNRVFTPDDCSSLIPHIIYCREILDREIGSHFGIMMNLRHSFRKAADLGILTPQPIPGDGYHYRIGLSESPAKEATVEDLVEITGFLLPSLDLSSDVRFEYTKKCTICGNYYQAKGAKAVFCSEKCRSRKRFKKGG